MEGGSAPKQGRGRGGECGATRRLTSQSAGTGPIRISIQYSQYAPRRLTGQGVPPPPPLPLHRPPIRLLQIVRWSWGPCDPSVVKE